MGSELGITADTAPRANLDSIGVFWIIFASLWTALLLGGMAFLYSKRNMSILRIRGLSTSFCAVIFLHCYWISVQLGYVLGPICPPNAEYWVMGTWLPFGIALFHASNSRFLHVADQQRKLAEGKISGRRVKEQKVGGGSGLLARFKRADYTQKIIVLVGIGMMIQLFLTVLMFLISRKWHSSFGIPGTEIGGTMMEKMVESGRGWEWWHTVFWQFFWAWIVAPIILWKSRGIHDTLGWRVQTVACCVANLHATPMWLIALYVPQMEAVNKYFVPPQWIAISIMITEIFTIFLPCYQVLAHQTLKKETLDTIAQWERKNQHTDHDGKNARSFASGSTMVESIMTGWKSTDGSIKSASSSESILTMSALEYVLERKPNPLLQFAALRDFSGENIAFLTSVVQWKSSLPKPDRRKSKASSEGDAELTPDLQELLRDRYNQALRIYTDYISCQDAEFPINISSSDLKKLEAAFEGPARIMYGDTRSNAEVHPATPFDMPPPSPTASSHGSEKTIVHSEDNGSDLMADRLQYYGEIPEDFNEHIFDDAEASIKYLVLTNTWPKFVKDRRASMDSWEGA